MRKILRGVVMPFYFCNVTLFPDRNCDVIFVRLLECNFYWFKITDASKSIIRWNRFHYVKSADMTWIDYITYNKQYRLPKRNVFSKMIHFVLEQSFIIFQYVD